MQTKKQNINAQLFVVTMLSACIGLLIVGSPSQVQAKNLIREELTRQFASENFSEENLASAETVDAENNLRIKRFVSKVRNLFKGLNLSQRNDFALGFFALPKTEQFELPQAKLFSYRSQRVSISNNHTISISNLARASL